MKSNRSIENLSDRADVIALLQPCLRFLPPSANDAHSEILDRLIEIIKAYNYLKTVVRGAG